MWRTWDQFINLPLGESPAVMLGEINNNRIEADKGENEIHVNRGAGTQTILAGSAEAVEKLGKHHQKAPKHEDRERNAPVVSLPLDDAGKLSGLETEAENQAKNAEDQASGRKEQGKEVSRRQASAAADRYAMVFGDTSTATGSAGAVVMTGAGEAITVETNDRFLRTDVENPDLMRNVVQRYDGYGTYKPRAYRVF